MARLVIKLFGCFQVLHSGLPQTGRLSDKGRALLAYLALETDRFHRREALAEMLWPNQPHPQGLANLRQCLHRLRHYLDDPGNSPPVLFVTHHEINFNCNSDCWLDAAEFNRLLNAVNTHHPADLCLCEVCFMNLQCAADLYQGDLLTGFSLPNTPYFDWWMLCKIEEYHRQAVFMLDRLVIHLKHNGDYLNASKYAQRAIKLEPWRERSHRMKMRALALGGNPVAAIRQYETCRQILAAELGVEPSLRTKNLLAQIREGCVHSLSNLVDEYQLMEPLAV
jgi:DNA-binding SARP family transcriptional activator